MSDPCSYLIKRRWIIRGIPNTDFLQRYYLFLFFFTPKLTFSASVCFHGVTKSREKKRNVREKKNFLESNEIPKAWSNTPFSPVPSKWKRVFIDDRISSRILIENPLTGASSSWWWVCRSILPLQLSREENVEGKLASGNFYNIRFAPVFLPVAAAYTARRQQLFATLSVALSSDLTARFPGDSKPSREINHRLVFTSRESFGTFASRYRIIHRTKISPFGGNTERKFVHWEECTESNWKECKRTTIETRAQSSRV